MANVLWNENAPAESDIADAAPIRSIVTSLRVGLAAEHVWPTSTGPGFGVHLLGSARAFYDLQSNVSSAGTDGRLFQTSDTSRLFHVGSAGTSFIGGNTVLSVGSQPAGGQRFYWALETGVEVIGAVPTGTVVFPNSGFSGAPFVVTSVFTGNPMMFVLTTVNGTQFAYQGYTKSGVATGNYNLYWMSIGTRTF